MTGWEEPFEGRLRWVAVDPATWRETGAVSGVVLGGSVDLDDSDPVKASASVDVDGPLDLSGGLLRLYLDAHGADGGVRTACIGTFGAEVPRLTVSSTGSVGSASLYGTLRLAQDSVPGASVHVPAGADPVAAAADALRRAGLQTVAERGPQRLAEARTYGLSTEGDAGDDLLSIASDLCGAAGFRDPAPDPWGRALLRRRLDDGARAPDWSLAEGPDCRFLDSMSLERDPAGPNCVKVVCSSGGGYTVATARDDDPASEASTVRRGREVWEVVRPSEALDNEGALALARRTLRERSAPLRTVTLRHIYFPLALGDVFDLSWPSAGLSGRFRASSVSYDLEAPGLLMTVKGEEVA